MAFRRSLFVVVGCIIAATVCLILVPLAASLEKEFVPMEITYDPATQLHTECLGGFPTVDELLAMQEGDYLLRMRDGKLTKVPAEKSRLPFDPKFHPQGGMVYRARDDLIYAAQTTVLSKSTDRGRTWTTLPDGAQRRPSQVLRDGTFIRVDVATGEGQTDPATVYHSTDEGRTWQKTTEIPIEVPGGYKMRYRHWTMTKLSDETLFFCVDLRDEEYGGDRFLTAGTVLTGYRSTDGGKTWQGPIRICEWAAEGGMVRLPSGRLLASVRYQGRPLLPDDPPALIALAGAGFKHHFLVESDDEGFTWKNLRPLTTVRGQCYGYPAVQSDGTVVVIHDTRYGPGPDAARAMISHDEGKIWQDEVYYMFFGKGLTGYSRSVVLDDDTILTVGGTSTDPRAKQIWEGAIGNSHLIAIRWKPVKD